MASEPVEHYSAEAADARARIADTIDAIQYKLDPRRIMNETVDKVQNGSEKLFSQVRDTAKDHPLAIGAAAAAIGLAFLARNRLSKARVDMGDGFSAYTDYDDDFSSVGRRGEAVADLAHEPEDGRSRADAARARARSAAARATESVQGNPIVSIVVGLLAGAALGAVLPPTETERRAFGATGRVGGAVRDTLRG